MAPENPRIIALFDVDGTLTIPRGEVTPEMMTFMKDLSKKITIGIVGGSDLPKQEEQLGEGIAKVFPYNFSQNGLVAYKDGELQEVQTIAKHLGEDNIKRIVNWTLKYLADVDIPVKVSMFACVLYMYMGYYTFFISLCIILRIGDFISPDTNLHKLSLYFHVCV